MYVYVHRHTETHGCVCVYVCTYTREVQEKKVFPVKFVALFSGFVLSRERSPVLHDTIRG
jgi:hypothetical protein